MLTPRRTQIMWPRLDGPPVPGGRRILGGFVAFLRRGDAETAVKEIGGLDWGGSVLRTGWGKSVPLPSRPIYGALLISIQLFLPMVSNVRVPKCRGRRSFPRRLEQPPTTTQLFLRRRPSPPARQSLPLSLPSPCPLETPTSLLRRLSLTLAVSLPTASSLARARGRRRREVPPDRRGQSPGAWGQL